MIITVIAAGSRGDVEPFVNLGVEMRKRGHCFRVCCLPKFKAYVEENGLVFFPLDFDGDYMMRALLSECKDGMAYLDGCKELYHRNPEMMDEVYAAAEGADLVLYILLGGFVHHVCEYLKIPCVRSFFYPFDKTRQFSMMMPELKENSFLNGFTYDISELGMNMVTMDLFNEWRVKHGLKKWDLFSDYRKLNGEKKLTLYPFSPYLVPRDPKWGEHITITGSWDRKEETVYEPDPLLQEFLEGGEEPLYVGFGSIVFKDMEEVQKKVLGAIRKTGSRAILSSSWMKWKQVDDPDLFFVDYVPHAWLFPQVRAVIHHGGAGTTFAGLKAGRPTQVIAFGGDQLFWGTRVYRNHLGPAPIDQEHKSWTIDDLAERIMEIKSGQYDESCKEGALELNREDGCKKAADILENYYNSKHKYKEI